MEHLETLACTVMEADKAYSAAHAAACDAKSPAEKVRLDLIKRQALRAYVDAKTAYDDALDSISLGRRVTGTVMAEAAE